MKRRGWIIIGLFLAATAPAAVNSWTSQVTGAWHHLTWSLGVRPDISQDAIMVTNYGQKAIIIDATTRDSFPSTLVISNLTVAGTSLSTNTVVLNYTGTTHPLRVFNNITVNPHGILLNLFGAISLEGTVNTLTINGGIVSQQGGSNYFNGNCAIGTKTDYGWYNLTNGMLWMGNVTVNSGGVFKQIDGSTTVASQFRTLQSYGSYVGNGAECRVVHGSLSSDSMLIGGGGSVYQGDATITANYFGVGELHDRFTESSGFYYMTNGTLVTGFSRISDFAEGYFYQYGGTHRTGVLQLAGDSRYGAAHYELDSGNLFCAGDESIQVGSPFIQNGGTNSTGGQIWLFDAYYTLRGGLLRSSSVLAEGDGAYGQQFESSFVQTNADHYVTNALTLGSFATYHLYGGKLVAGLIELTRSGTYPPSFFDHSGGSLSSGAMIFSGGTLFASGTEMLGTLTLRGGRSVDSLSSNCVQHFLASAVIPWDASAMLEIDGWHSGVNHIFVGNSADALTARQLQQITFASGGFGKLLANGELVSWPVPALAFEQNTNLTFVWPGTAVLQWADNVAGPYVDVPGASSPFTPSIVGPYKFFRLRQG